MVVAIDNKTTVNACNKKKLPMKPFFWVNDQIKNLDSRTEQNEK
jgi:hypothetical protein